LKNNYHDEALQALKEVEELERVLYGDSSFNLGKTYKIIGTLYIIIGSVQEAREYLMRAHAIFEQRGLLKQLKETKSKLKMLNQSAKQAAELAMSELVENSGDESGKEQSQERMPRGNSKKPKKSNATKIPAGKVKKGTKRRVVRNNFMTSGNEGS